MRSLIVLATAVLAAAFTLGGPGTGTAPSGLALAQDAYEDGVIRRAFESVVRRDPTSRELRRYRVLMDRYGWTEADVTRDLRERTDYRKLSGQGTGIDQAIRQAYQDILDRAPDAEGLAHYRRRIVDEGWTEQQVRESLRESPEYQSPDRRTASADRIVRRAYRDVLRREPDPGGLENYRRMVVEEGWDAHDVRQALRRSPERQQSRRALTEAEATEIVRRSYVSVLGREPDEAGLRQYRDRLLRDGWTEAQLVDTLRKSSEYRTRNR